MQNDLQRVPDNSEASGGSYGVYRNDLDTFPEPRNDGVQRSGVGFGFLQHEDRGFVLSNLFLKHSVLVRAVDAFYILGDDFHWVTEGLEGKNYVS